MESNNSGVNSPPLWNTTTSPSPTKSPTHPLLDHRALSPNSRAQAIARGQWELMEMVKNMPETSYELSLKDLVENQKSEINQANQTGDNGSLEINNQSLHQRGVMKVRRQQENRNVSFENNNKGLFLNMVFPFSYKSKRKNDHKFGVMKVSPNPHEGMKSGERDWWKKRFTGSSDSDSSRTSIGTTTTTGSSGGRSNSSGGGGGGGRKINGLLSSCWPCFHSRESKSVE